MMKRNSANDFKRQLLSYLRISGLSFREGDVFFLDEMAHLLKEFTEQGINPDGIIQGHFTLLHLAVIKNDPHRVSQLLSRGAAVNATMVTGLSPLHVATGIIDITQKDNVEIIQKLLFYGANIEQKTRKKGGYTPLHMAVLANRIDITELLLNNSANIEAKTNQDLTALHLAAEVGSSEITYLLLRRRANVNAQTKCGYTPLHAAAEKVDTTADRHQRARIATMLLECGAHINAETEEGFTPLHISAERGCKRVTTLLIQYGANVNAKTKENFTPLYAALKTKRFNIANYLLDAGAEVNQKTKKKLITPLHAAVEKGLCSVVRHLLLRPEINVNPETDQGFTPLHIAAYNHRLDLPRLLLQQGANVNVKTKENFTPLHIAVERGYQRTTDLLIQYGANVNAKTKQGFTPLHLAAKKGLLGITLFLLDRGAEIKAKTEQGITPFRTATQNNHTDIARLLILKMMGTSEKVIPPSTDWPPNRQTTLPGLFRGHKRPFSTTTEDRTSEASLAEDGRSTTFLR